jgi:hypothetical protein
MIEIIHKTKLTKITSKSRINLDKLTDPIQKIKLKTNKIIIINLTNRKYLQRFKIYRII